MQGPGHQKRIGPAAEHAADHEGGDVPWDLPHAFGLYYRDTRFVNGLTLRLQHMSLVALGNMYFGGHDAPSIWPIAPFVTRWSIRCAGA